MLLPPPRSKVAVAGGLGRFDLSCCARKTVAHNARPRHITAVLTKILLIGSPLEFSFRGQRGLTGKAETLPRVFNRICPSVASALPSLGSGSPSSDQRSWSCSVLVYSAGAACRQPVPPRCAVTFFRGWQCAAVSSTSVPHY